MYSETSVRRILIVVLLVRYAGLLRDCTLVCMPTNLKIYQ